MQFHFNLNIESATLTHTSRGNSYSTSGDWRHKGVLRWLVNAAMLQQAPPVDEITNSIINLFSTYRTNLLHSIIIIQIIIILKKTIYNIWNLDIIKQWCVGRRMNKSDYLSTVHSREMGNFVVNIVRDELAMICVLWMHNSHHCLCLTYPMIYDPGHLIWPSCAAATVTNQADNMHILQADLDGLSCRPGVRTWNAEGELCRRQHDTVGVHACVCLTAIPCVCCAYVRQSLI